MSVSPASSRAGWHTSQPTGPGRPPGAQRRPPSAGAPALTVTLSIPLGGEEVLTPSAQRLLDAARELLEHGQATVISGQSLGDRRTAEPAALRPPARPATPEPNDAGQVSTEASAADPTSPEVRILAASRSVLLDDQPLPLTRLEFDLLLHLVEHPGGSSPGCNCSPPSGATSTPAYARSTCTYVGCAARSARTSPWSPPCTGWATDSPTRRGSPSTRPADPVRAGWTG